MQITPSHLREHGLKHHNAACLIRWLGRHNLDWRTFFKDGYDHTELVAAAGADDPELRALLAHHGLLDT